MKAQYGANLQLANHLNRVLAQAKSAGLELPSQIQVPGDYHAEYGNVDAAAHTEADGTIVINESSDVWEDVAGFIRRSGPEGSGYLSTSDERHIVLHELGHVAHMKSDFERAVSPEFDSVEDQDVAAKVSALAASMPGEFVAETFVGLIIGVQYPQEVMDLYRRLGGPVREGRP